MPLLIVLIVFLAIGAFGFRAMAADVLVVSSGDAEPYKITESKVLSDLVRLGHAPRKVSLENLTNEQLKTFEDEGVNFVAIGSTAASSLNERLSSRSLLVYCMVSDPKGRGLLQRERTTGISTQVPISAQIGIVAEALPQARKIGMLFNSESAASRTLLGGVTAALPEGWGLLAIDVKQYKTPADAVQALFDAKPDVVWTSNDSSVLESATIHSLLLAALRSKTPVFGFSAPFVRAGALFGVGIDAETQGSDAAALIHRVIAEGLPTDRAWRHRAPRYDIAVNLIVAEELRLSLPPSIVERAKHRFTRSSGGGE